MWGWYKEGGQAYLRECRQCGFGRDGGIQGFRAWPVCCMLWSEVFRRGNSAYGCRTSFPEAEALRRQGSEHEACGGIQRGQCACSLVCGRIFRSGAFCRYCCHRGLCPVEQPFTDAAHPKKRADCGCLQRQSFKYGCCPEQFCGF